MKARTLEEKEEAKGSFGFNPLLAYLDETGESLAGLLRPGNAGSPAADLPVGGRALPRNARYVRCVASDAIPSLTRRTCRGCAPADDATASWPKQWRAGSSLAWLL